RAETEVVRAPRTNEGVEPGRRRAGDGTHGLVPEGRTRGAPALQLRDRGAAQRWGDQGRLRLRRASGQPLARGPSSPGPEGRRRAGERGSGRGSTPRRGRRY